MAPQKTIAWAALLGRKKGEDRILILLAVNASGTSKYEPMFIGKSRMPRCFKKRTPKELQLDSHSNSKACMTSALFFDWLHRFDAFKGSGRRVLLLVDNCSAHGMAQNLPDLHNVTVHFLPPNTTSKIQPLDAGIRATLKVHYCRRMILHALDLSDKGETEVYKTDVLMAMNWAKEIWNSMRHCTIQNCWGATNLIYYRATEGLAAIDRDLGEICAEVNGYIEQRVPHFNRISVQELLNEDGTEPCTQVVD